MSPSDTKSLQTLLEGLDAADIISIMERLHAAAASGQWNMSEASDPQSKQAIFQAAIGLLEDDLAKRGAVVRAFRELYSGTALSSSEATIPNGLDTSGGAPPSANAPTQAETPSGDVTAPAEAISGYAKAPTRAASNTFSAVPAPYYFCDKCEFWVKPGMSHTCTAAGPTEDCFNAFHNEELDVIHGPDGWEEIDPPEPAELPDAASPHTGGQVKETRTSIENGEALLEEEDSEAREDLLRHNSKLDRVYKMVKDLIETNGPMHIDGMLGPASKRGLFLGVQNQRSNLANFLSKLKGRGLLISDNRGFWSLPKGKAAE